MPITAVSATTPFIPTPVTGPAATADGPVNPLAQGDSLQVGQQGVLPAALRQKLAGKVPAGITLEGLGATDAPTLRTVAMQAKQPRAITHEEALRVRRAALTQLQAGAMPGSPVAAIAGATVAILDGGAGAGTFRLTEFADRVLDWVAMAGDEQFAVTPGVTVTDGLKVMIRGLLDTRGADPTSDGPVFRAALAQAAQMAAPGSFVSVLVKAHDSLGRQVTSARDNAQLAEQALNELTTITAFDTLGGNSPKALRAVAKHANWALTWTDVERITLKAAAVRTIAGMATAGSKVAYVANDALRLVAGAASTTEQDQILKSALDVIAGARDDEF